jgi:hypothetical protein
MLRPLGSGTRLCDGWDRREILRVGGLGLFGGGPTLGDLSTVGLANGDAGVAGIPPGRAKSRNVLFLTGGPPQHSTWAPRPDTPPEVRGESGTIPTVVPGLRIRSSLPRTAQVADKLRPLRAVSTGGDAHSSDSDGREADAS